ncbi:MAG: hypothetical protein FWC43_14875 [Planctomycetaceae bacterium]|nr:hypothetical protein [Planctomycetaceae bacterium]
MRSEVIIEEMMTKVKSNLQNHAEKLDASLTAENAQIVTKIIMAAVIEAALTGFKTYIQENEIRENTIDHEEQTYQFNRTSTKEFSTVFGKTTIERRLYQNSSGESFVPLDHAWNMEGQFATIEVREAVLFALSLMTACEARQIFDKCATFNLAESSFKKIAQNMDSYLEDNIDDLLETIRTEEVLPLEEIKVVAVSQDGVNVLLQEPGKKKGRKRKRPGERKTETEAGFDSPTSYKNAVVGSVSLYGDVPADAKAPLRLQSRYVARMPEEKALTLKAQLQKEVESTLNRLPDNVTKIFVSDAAQGIRKEVDTNPLFDGFEKIIDFFHTTDHLSSAAEAIFGQGNDEGEKWYESKRLLLLEEEDGAEDVYRSLLYYQKMYHYSKERRESLSREISFFRNNKSRMEYKRFRDSGWPIGSGVIEAACKSIVKCRFCRSGMRWTRTGGQTILTLRTLVKSGRWESFWTRYKTTHFTKNRKTAT